jgi:hypothetical protein
MAQSIRALAYGSVAAVGVSLFAIGTPAKRGGETPVIAISEAHATPSGSIASGNGITLQSTSVEFPNDYHSFPEGPAAEVVTDNCTACHSAGMILNQPKLTTAQWQAEVTHMQKDFKAPVAEQDVAPIVAYLARIGDTK